MLLAIPEAHLTRPSPCQKPLLHALSRTGSPSYMSLVIPEAPPPPPMHVLSSAPAIFPHVLSSVKAVVLLIPCCVYCFWFLIFDLKIPGCRLENVMPCVVFRVICYIYGFRFDTFVFNKRSMSYTLLSVHCNSLQICPLQTNFITEVVCWEYESSSVSLRLRLLSPTASGEIIWKRLAVVAGSTNSSLLIIFFFFVYSLRLFYHFSHCLLGLLFFDSAIFASPPHVLSPFFPRFVRWQRHSSKH